MFTSVDDRKAPGDPWIHHTVSQESDTKPSEDITMFRFMQRFGRDSRARGRGTAPMTRVRRRNHRLNCEALESRQLLSGYYIVNEASGKVLDDPGSSSSNGAHIDQWQLNGGTNQRWDLVPVGNGNYAIENEASHLVLDNSLSNSNGTVIDQWQSYGGTNQQWQLEKTQTQGVYVISNAYSHKVLDNSISTSNGTKIDQWQPTGGTNQQWTLLAAGNAPVVTEYVVNASSGKVLYDPNFSTSNGTAIQQYQPNGGTNQQWNISPFANPVAITAYSPAPAGTPLFKNGGPSSLDVAQGTDPSTVGDCWLEASLAEVAARDPQDIRNMFTYDGTTVDNGATVGLYTVRFFNTSGSAVYVKVDTEFPSGGDYYDHVRNDLGTQVLWVALAEKAYAVANGQGYVTTANQYQDSYNALFGGWPSWALPAITGKPAGNYSINSTNLASDWNSGDLIELVTSSPRSSYLFPNHVYALVGYNPASSKPFELFNPWGTDSSGWCPGETNKIYGVVWVNAAFISQNFIKQSIGHG